MLLSGLGPPQPFGLRSQQTKMFLNEEEREVGATGLQVCH